MAIRRNLIVGPAVLLSFVFAMIFTGCSEKTAKVSGDSSAMSGVKGEVTESKKGGKMTGTLPPGVYAVFNTSKGKITFRLFDDKAPVTVANFTGLAEAKKEWTAGTGEKKKTRFYDGLIFHRVIPNFMIQGGDPLGNGTGGPGYKFQDEFHAELKFDKPGFLAMANSGANTNGSQFFITVAPTPHLTNRHTIFGQVVEGYDVADAISKVPTGSQNRPAEPVTMKVEILRVKK